MTDTILVLNAGSSSIKFSLFAEGGGEPTVVARGQIEGIDTAPHFIAKDAAGQTVGRAVAGRRAPSSATTARWPTSSTCCEATYGAQHQLTAVGHRVVHGGLDYSAPVRVDRDVVAKLEKLVPLAPLHQPHNLAPIRQPAGAHAAAAADRLLRHRLPPHESARWRRCSPCPGS